MKITCTAFAALVFLLPPAFAQDSLPLYGRWKTVESTITMTDGSSRKHALSCIATYERTRTVNVCDAGEGKKTRVVSKLLQVTAGMYEIEVVESNDPKAVGARNKVEYKIENGVLTLSAPAARPGTTVLRIESKLVRQ